MAHPPGPRSPYPDILGGIRTANNYFWNTRIGQGTASRHLAFGAPPLAYDQEHITWVKQPLAEAATIGDHPPVLVQMPRTLDRKPQMEPLAFTKEAMNM